MKSDEILASNGLIHRELVGLFEDMFAGRDLAPIPSARRVCRSAEKQGKKRQLLAASFQLLAHRRFS